MDSTREGKYLTHQLQQKALYYYTRSRSHQGDRSTPRKNEYEPESYLKDDYLDKSYVTGQKSTNALVIVVPFHYRAVGPLNLDLGVIKEANKNVLQTYSVPIIAAYDHDRHTIIKGHLRGLCPHKKPYF